MVTYNGIAFDDEVLRHRFYANLIQSYLTQRRGSSRFDVLTAARATVACNPYKLNVPQNSEGYACHPDPLRRELVLEPVGADIVRRIYHLYRELGALRDVESAAAAEGIASKRHVFASGRVQGGGALSRGQIYYILTNPVYLDRVRHKLETYTAAHEPIIADDLWQALQAQLQLNAAKPRGARTSLTAPGKNPISRQAHLIGKLRDETGDLLTPTHTQRHGRRYHYYISNRLVSGSPDQSAWRIPAQTLETSLQSVVANHLQEAVKGLRTHAVPDAGQSSRCWRRRVRRSRMARV